MNRDIKSFTDLDAWRQSHLLVVETYKTLSKLDQYDSLKVQMERCAVSIASNIAEGFGRQTANDKKHFYVMARGFAYELQNQLLIARDVNKLSTDEFKKLANQSLESIRLLHGLIRSINKVENATS